MGVPNDFTFVFVKFPRWLPWRHNCDFSTRSDLYEIWYIWSSRCTNWFWVIFMFIEYPIWPPWQPFWIFVEMLSRLYFLGTKGDRDIGFSLLVSAHLVYMPIWKLGVYDIQNGRYDVICKMGQISNFLNNSPILT